MKCQARVHHSYFSLFPGLPKLSNTTFQFGSKTSRMFFSKNCVTRLWLKCGVRMASTASLGAPLIVSVPGPQFGTEIPIPTSPVYPIPLPVEFGPASLASPTGPVTQAAMSEGKTILRKSSGPDGCTTRPSPRSMSF